MADNNGRVSAAFASSVRECPQCEGTGAFVDPFGQRMDKPCSLCGGTKEVDLNRICICGRPIVWKYHGCFICNSDNCAKRIDDGEKAEKDRQAMARQSRLNVPFVPTSDIVKPGDRLWQRPRTSWEIECDLADTGMTDEQIQDFIRMNYGLL